MQIKQIVKDFKLRGAGEFVVNKYPTLERGKILNYILIFTTNDYESNHHYHNNKQDNNCLSITEISHYIFTLC